MQAFEEALTHHAVANDENALPGHFELQEKAEPKKTSCTGRPEQDAVVLEHVVLIAGDASPRLAALLYKALSNCHATVGN